MRSPRPQGISLANLFSPRILEGGEIFLRKKVYQCETLGFNQKKVKFFNLTQNLHKTLSQELNIPICFIFHHFSKKSTFLAIFREEINSNEAHLLKH